MKNSGMNILAYNPSAVVDAEGISIYRTRDIIERSICALA
jgi:hypothetical protein